MKATERTTTNRSAGLRVERSQREQERVTQASQRARNPGTMPPVMSRGDMAGNAGSRKKRVQTNLRRKYYYSIGATGTEVRLPALPALNPSWRMLSGALVIALLAAIWAMWSSPMFQVNKINIQGLTRIPRADILSALNLEGESILQANPNDIKQTLEQAFPDIAKASVQVGIPASVSVRIQERTPVISWKDEKETLWIDANGIAYPPRGEQSGLVLVEAKGSPKSPAPAAKDSTKNADKLPVVDTGKAIDLAKPDSGPFLSSDLMVAIQKLGKQLPEKTTIMYDSRYGLGWKDPSGWAVYFGSSIDEMDLKLKQYQVITGELAKQNIHPAMISVEFPNAPFYRLEP